MRSALAVLVLVVAVVIGAASAAGADSRVNPPVVAQQTSGSGAQPPAIVPNPNERGTNNIGGLVVGVVLLGGWLAGGTVILVKARRRADRGRAAELGTVPGTS